jgi:hypothetical protein
MLVARSIVVQLEKTESSWIKKAFEVCANLVVGEFLYKLGLGRFDNIIRLDLLSDDKQKLILKNKDEITKNFKIIN